MPVMHALLDQPVLMEAIQKSTVELVSTLKLLPKSVSSVQQVLNAQVVILKLNVVMVIMLPKGQLLVLHVLKVSIALR